MTCCHWGTPEQHYTGLLVLALALGVMFALGVIAAYLEAKARRRRR
jgi:hypothetical protein